MPKRSQRPNDRGFNLATLAQMIAIPALSAGFIFFAEWIKNGDTLQRHEVEIAAEIKDRHADQEKQNEAREKLSAALLSYADKTQASIASLTTQSQVQGEQIKNIDTTLGHVVAGLQNIQTAVGRK